MKRDNTEKRAKGDKFEPPDDPLFQERPCLADACCNPFWDDKSEKGCWTLSLNWDTGQCMVSVTDRDNSRSLNSTAETSTDALDAMEGLLGSDRRPWRYWGKKRR